MWASTVVSEGCCERFCVLWACFLGFDTSGSRGTHRAEHRIKLPAHAGPQELSESQLYTYLGTTMSRRPDTAGGVQKCENSEGTDVCENKNGSPHRGGGSGPPGPP